MKRILYVTLLSFLLCAHVCAQSVEIAFALPSGQDQLTGNTAKILRSKFLPAMMESGVETTEIGTIAIKPEISFLNRQVVETGMRNIHTSDIQFNFCCTNLVTGTTYATCVITIRGEGNSDDDAIKNALTKLSSQDQKLNTFVQTAKAKVIDYYQRNLSSVLSRAQTFANMQQYGEGLALLFSCPSTISGYTKINTAITSIYEQYMTKECSSILQNARTEYINGNYRTAIYYLQQIDMTSSCATEAEKLCLQIKQSKDTEARQAAELLEKQAQREADIEKRRIKAARDIAVAYCKRRSDIIFVW